MISIGLNLMLGVLLFCALILGLRLERKLRGLRDSHADFAKAVGELDQAAGRTETSLASLRAGTETAKSEVASRIDQARVACQRLEKLVADADKAAVRLSQPLALLDRAPPPARSVQAPPPAPAPSAIARPEPEFLRPAAPVQTRPASEPAPARSRAKLVDDDLFAQGPAAAVRPQAERPQAERPQAERPLAAPAQSVRPPAAREREVDPFVAMAPAPQRVALKADNDPVIGLSRTDRAAREALFREMLDGDATPELDAFDPFEQGRFVHERRAMLAAVVGGRR
jgi:hypothetical protein